MTSDSITAEKMPVATKPVSVVRHRALVRITHWLNAIFLTGMIASGLQIYAAYPHFGPHDAVYNIPNPIDAAYVSALPKTILLGGWLAGGLRWHFTLAWGFVFTGLAYLGFLIVSGEWRALLFTRKDIAGSIQMIRYYLKLRPDHPVQGKHNPLQKQAYTFILVLGIISVVTGFAIAKPVQLSLLVTILGGYQLARYWHMVAVWTFAAFTVVHVVMVFAADPASFRAIITGRYRGRFPNHG